VLKRAAQRDTPTLIARLLNQGLSAVNHRQIEHFDDLREARVSSISIDADGTLRPFPVQVDGDYIGELSQAELRVEPGALTVVA
jgi:diacylglycerol kinase family enzyme